jgi:hypothetical protein
MSKYNLTDILEQYKIGSGWTNDFDYEGMLNTGLSTSIDTPIEVLKKMSDDFEDVNYHRENNHLQNAIDALEIGDMMEAEGKLSDFHAEIRKTMETFDMDMSDDLGAYMASKMDLDEDKYDDIVDADDDIPADKKKAAALAYRKVDRGASYEKATSHVNEVRIEKEVASRIEGLMNIQLKKQFLDVFEDLWLDLIEEDPFYAEDVIAHLSNEMYKQISNRQAQGDRLAGMEESDSYVDEIGEGAMQPGEADLEAGVKGNMDALNEVSMKDVVLAIVKDTNATNPEVQMYIDSLTKDIKLNGKESYSDYEIDDYIEDFKNYISDKSLQEHFGRFMKDYQ